MKCDPIIPIAKNNSPPTNGNKTVWPPTLRHGCGVLETVRWSTAGQWALSARRSWPRTALISCRCCCTAFPGPAWLCLRTCPRTCRPAAAWSRSPRRTSSAPVLGSSRPSRIPIPATKRVLHYNRHRYINYTRRIIISSAAVPGDGVLLSVRR